MRIALKNCNFENLMVMNKKPRKIPSKGERRNWTPVNAFVSVKLTDEVVKAQTRAHKVVSGTTRNGSAKVLIP
jgi:hypothetical protein